MHLALATCADLPDWEVDDRPLHDALRRRGARVDRPVWTDASVDWRAFDACLIRTTWDYQEHRAEFVAWAERVSRVTRLFNPADVVRWNTHKWYLRDLEARGIPVAPTVWLESGRPAGLGEIVAARGWPRAFLKPAVGATARETMRFTTSGPELLAAQAHVDRLLPQEDMLLQPYLESVEREGELSAIFIDGRLSHAVRKIPVPGDYRVQDDFGAHDEPSQVSDDERALAERAIAAVAAPLLYGRVDMLRGGGGERYVTELEVVEPSLFFRHDAGAADRLADALCARCG